MELDFNVVKAEQRRLAVKAFGGEEMFDNLPVGCMMFTFDGTIIAVNKRFAEILSYNEEEIVGHNFLEFAVKRKETKKTYLDLVKGDASPNAVYHNQYYNKQGKAVDMYWLVPRATVTSKINYAIVTNSFEIVEI